MHQSGRRSFRAGLSVAALLVLTAPAPLMAKKEKSPAYELSKEFRAAALPVQSALALGDAATARSRIGSLDILARTPAEKYALGTLRMELAAKQADPQAQRKALTLMLDSGGAPAAEVPYLRYLAGYFSYVLNELGDAKAQLSYARQLGYNSPQLTLMLSDIALRQGQNAEGLALLSQAIADQKAAGGLVDAPWYDRAAAFSYKAKDWSNLAFWYRQKLGMFPSPENWRTAVVNYLDNPVLSPDMKLDLYRLLAAQGAMATERDYQAYAQLAADNGQYGEAKAVIESGRASGKLVATDNVTSTLLKTATARAAKEKPALAAKAAKAGAAAEAADGYLAVADYAKAAELYRKALGEMPADAGRINTRLGMALARSGDSAGAQQVLSAVSGPWADIAQFWLLWSAQKGVIQPAQG